MPASCVCARTRIASKNKETRGKSFKEKKKTRDTVERTSLGSDSEDRLKKKDKRENKEKTLHRNSQNWRYMAPPKAGN